MVPLCDVCNLGPSVGAPLHASPAAAAGFVWHYHAACYLREFGEVHPALLPGYRGPGYVVAVESEGSASGG